MIAVAFGLLLCASRLVVSGMGSSPCGCSDIFRLLSGVCGRLLLPVSHLACYLSTCLDLGGHQSHCWLPACCSRISHFGRTRSYPHPRATLKAIKVAPNPSSATHAPTAHPVSCMTSQLRVMPVRAD